MRKPFYTMSALILTAFCALPDCIAQAPNKQLDASNEDTVKVVDYLFSLFKVKERIKHIARSQTENEPELQDISMQVLGSVDVSLLSAQFSRLVKIPPSSMPYCQSFIRSEAAAAALAAAAVSESDAQLMEKLQALPPKQSNAIVEYFNSPCMTAVVAAMNSAEGKSFFYESGQNIVCKYVAEKRPKDMELMHKSGKCRDLPAM